MELYLVQNQKENCHHDHIPFNVKGIGTIVFSVHGLGKLHQRDMSVSRHDGAPLKHLNTIVLQCKQGLQSGPHDAEREASPG